MQEDVLVDNEEHFPAFLVATFMKNIGFTVVFSQYYTKDLSIRIGLNPFVTSTIQTQSKGFMTYQ